MSTEEMRDPGESAMFQSASASPAELLARARQKQEEATLATAAPPEDSEFDLKSGEGLREGWYAPELLDGVPIRWTTRRFAFDATVAGATHVLLEACLFPESGFAEARARLRVNEVPGGAVRLRPGWNSTRLPIPPGVAGRTHFLVDAGFSWCPASAGTSADERELGLAIRRVALVRFLDLPPLPVSPEPSVEPEGAVSAARDTFALRLARRLRRLLLGWELWNRLQRVQELEQRIRRLEHSLHGALSVIACRINSLAEMDEEVRRDWRDAVEARREDLRRDGLNRDSHD